MSNNNQQSELAQKKEKLLQLLKEKQATERQNHIVQSDDARVQFPVSFNQQGVWLVNQVEGTSHHYNAPAVFDIKGHFNIEVAEQAFNKVIEHHAILRTNYHMIDGELVQRINDNCKLSINVFDLTTAHKSYSDVLKQQVTHSFDFEHELMLRVSYVKRTADAGTLVCNVHHIACDGISLKLIFSCFSKYYEALLEGHDLKVVLPPVRYGDFAIWQREKFGEDKPSASLGYWNTQLSGGQTALTLPSSVMSEDNSSLEGGEYSFAINSTLHLEIKEQLKVQGVTMHMWLHAAYVVLLHLLSGEKDILLRTPFANRSNNQLKEVVGMFTNELPLRSKIDPNVKFSEFLQDIRSLNLETQNHQDVPSELLAKILAAYNNAHVAKGAQVAFRVDDHQLDGFDFSHCQLLLNKRQTEYVKHDLTLAMSLNNDELNMVFEYRNSSFKLHDIIAFSKSFITLITALCQNPDRLISSLDLIQSEQVPVNSANENEGEVLTGSFIEAFESNVLANPDAIAILEGDKSLSYYDLSQRVKRVSAALQGRSVQPRDLVAISLQKRSTTLTVILAVLKLGASFVLLSEKLPYARKAYIIDNSNASLLVTDSTLTELSDLVEVISYQALECDPCELDLSQIIVTKSSLAYVCYTSGTSGYPKGAKIAHEGILNLSKNMSKIMDSFFEVGTSLRWTTHAEPSFDASLQVVSQLANNVTLVTPPDTKEPKALVEFLQTNSVDVFDCTPSQLDLMLPYLELANIQKRLVLVIGGEPISETLWGKIAQLSSLTNIRAMNVYGLTECSVNSTYAEISGNTPHIGQALDNVSLYIIGSSGKRLPDGLPGELYIGGCGVAKGYINNPELTRERFVTIAQSDHDLVYKTGDLCRINEEGNIEFLGRMDDQVKIRGYRIELREIDEHLSQLDGIEQVISVLAGEGEHKYIVTHLKIENTITAKSAFEVCKKHITEHLPSYMLPSSFTVLEHIPLTVHGKIDKSKLPDVLPGAHLKTANSSIAHGLAKRLQNIWQTVLKRDDISLNDNFFDVGGNSLLGVHLAQAISQEFSTDFTVRDIFKYPTIMLLKEYFSDVGETSAEAVDDMSQSEELSPDIAIIGYSGRFPDAESVEILWQNIQQKKESITHYTTEELLKAGISQTELENSNYVKSGFVLDNIKAFDAQYFGMTPNEAKVLDPQQRVLFECATEALQHAGYGDIQAPQNIGIFCGTGESQYFFNHILPNQDIVNSQGLKALHGNSPAFTATRLAYQLNFTGPALNILTACSTSLVSVHQACMSIKNAECTAALAGGASVRRFDKQGYQFEDGNILSADGHCRAFDDEASGTREGDGGGFIVLKLLSKAILDGDQIHAVIKGSAVNNDGSQKAGYVAPGVAGQASVIQKAIQNAGIPSHTISYIEAHGTGTKIGDPLEIEALKQVFKNTEEVKHKIAISSLKPNIGHLDTGAGIAGLLKVVMALKNKALPPTINFDLLNKNIDLGSSLYINDKLIPWPQSDYPMRAGISAFGVGGTNAHIVLEEAPSRDVEDSAEPAHTLLLSAKSEQALKDIYHRYNTFFYDLEESKVACTAYTSQVGVNHHKIRKAIVFSNISDLLVKLENVTFKKVSNNTQPPSIIMMFSGQGTQFSKMGTELLEFEPTFRIAFMQCRDILAPLLDLDIAELLQSKGKHTEAFEQGETWVIQPLLFAIEYSLYQLLQNKGIKADVLIGHSLGEYVAACIAGVFSLDDALNMVVVRGRLMHQAKPGAMLSVLANYKDVESILDTCSIAAVNSDRHCVLSGTLESIEHWQVTLKESGIRTKLLTSGGAYHSPLMDPILEAFHAAIKTVKFNQPTIPIVSNVTGQYLTDEVVTADYWIEHIRKTVWFSKGIEKIAETDWLNERKVFVEIGPSSGLVSFARDNVKLVAPEALQTMTKNQSEYALVQTVIARCWESGISIDWQNMQRPRMLYRTPLPHYPFQRKEYWVDRVSQADAFSAKDAKEDSKPVSECLYEPVWMAKYADVELAGASLDPKVALIFIDQQGVCRDIAAKLQANGCQVYTASMRSNEVGYISSDYYFEHNNQADYAKILNDIKKRESSLDLIIHGFNIDSETDFSCENHHADFELGAYSLLHLAQALNAEITDQKRCVLKVLGSHTLNVGHYVNPYKQALTATVRVIENEVPFIRTQLIDISDAVGNLTESDLVTVLGDVEHQVVAIKRGVSWYREYRKLPVTEQPQEFGLSSVKENNIYLLTGGSGGIAQQVAKWLSTSAPVSIVLVSRKPIPPRSHWQDILNGEDSKQKSIINTIELVESRGSQVHVYTADISVHREFEQVYNTILEQVGRPNGVFHTAGIPSGRILPLVSREEAEKVFAPKVAGSLNLLNIIDINYVDFIINFSSISALNGSIGQFDYATANAFQDALPDINPLYKTKVKSINWDTWKEVGMAVNSNIPKEYQEILEQQLDKGLSNQEGLLALTYVLTSNKRNVVVAKSSMPPNFEVPFDLTLEKSTEVQLSMAPVVAGTGTSSIEQSMKDLWLEILGVEVTSPNDDFFELGGDSLSLSKLLAHINHHWKIDLSLKQVFDKTDFSSMLTLVPSEALDTNENEYRTSLSHLWQDIIGVEVSSVHDDFFELGGDSLSLSKLVVHINHTWQINIPVKEAFEKTQFEDMLNLITSYVSDVEAEAEAEFEEGVI
ncbi:type I polyketide synthase [Pseudoalteromonas aurantia]|uniref:Non-ribosomal peptide synthetase n=1 Tax=Pseudoalteromonas aurantia TaxID=43654 RepID=A0A5S3VDY8_9GAMM|nr:type I polyketide synthase [Pseudoalteromonas aurantia]TMO69888.1 hypothetical protein CWC19_03365 [Pseudoalteromonas aurantia]